MIKKKKHDYAQGNTFREYKFRNLFNPRKS